MKGNISMTIGKFMAGGLMALCLGAGAAPSVLAQQQQQQSHKSGWYGSLGGSLGFRSDSNNSGALTGDFTTGAGTNIPAGTVLDSGTALGWNTEYDTGFGLNGAVGYRLGNGFRVEAELAYFDNDVDLHNGLTAGANALDGEDAGVLTTGSANVGATVGSVIADGRGSTSILAPMLNAYYDFNLDSPLKPYLGGGVGWAMTDVEFNPSGVDIADDDDDSFAWQLKGGLTFDVSNRVELFAEYRYFNGGDANVDLNLLPASLDVENEIHSVGVGLRFNLY